MQLPQSSILKIPVVFPSPLTVPNAANTAGNFGVLFGGLDTGKPTKPAQPKISFHVQSAKKRDAVIINGRWVSLGAKFCQVIAASCKVA